MAKTRDDQNLVARFHAGDKAAFEQIVEQHDRGVAGLVYRLLGWSGDVDDVTQDVFLAVYRHLHRFRGDCSLKSWIFTIAVNQCRSARYRRMIYLKRKEIAPGIDQPCGATLAQMAETHEAVRRAVARLPARLREPVVLVYLEGLAVAEVCKILKISTNTCHVRLSRARGQLKQSLEKMSVL
ncbi:MAG: RNA polymerase sigma factor [Phycisphaeraceae bacterium]|nr:RNA polymerase sigma factor [Phycisphaeraceae bacterium]